MGVKTCPKCKITKDYSDFYKCKTHKNNCSTYCKVCSNERTTSYARNNKDKIPTTGYSLKRRYGISSEEYLAMLEQQGNKCAICEIDQCITGRAFAVDHDHTTKQIRGLLCSACNTGLGMFKDNTKLLQQASEYLNKPYEHKI